MKAIVVRRKSDGAVVCFGPDNGQYAPHVDTAIMTSASEPDYDAVVAEWTAAHPAPSDRRAVVLANPAVPQWFKDWIA